ncbi:hypothetical protein QTP88_012951 [Uroleucon formosanum]
MKITIYSQKEEIIYYLDYTCTLYVTFGVTVVTTPHINLVLRGPLMISLAAIIIIINKIYQESSTKV